MPPRGVCSGGPDGQTWACLQEAGGLRKKISSKWPPPRVESDQRATGPWHGAGCKDTHLLGTQTCQLGTGHLHTEKYLSFVSLFYK